MCLWFSLLQGSLDGYLDKSCGFQIHLCIPACIMSGEFIYQVVIKLSTSSVSLNLIFMSSKQFYPFKDVQSDQIQGGYRKKFTAYYARRNANLKLTLVATMTNGFLFKIIDSLMVSIEVRLTWRDCKDTNYTWYV